MSTPTSPTDTRPKVNPKDVAEAIESDRVTADDLQKFEQKYNEHSVRGAVPKQVTSDVLECRHFLYSVPIFSSRFSSKQFKVQQSSILKISAQRK